MAKKKQQLPFPMEMIKSIEDDFPKCWEYIDKMRQCRGIEFDSWDELCYIPIPAVNAILMETYSYKDSFLMNLPSILAGGASWKQYKQIYSFPPELVQLLIQNDEDMEIPVEIIKRLPYPSLYIELDGSFDDINGILVYFDDTVDCGLELRFIVNSGNRNEMQDVMNYWITLEEGLTISESIRRAIDDIKAKAGDFNVRRITSQSEISMEIEQLYDLYMDILPKLLQLVLYLCAENAEVEENPQQKQIYRPAKTPRESKNVYREVRKWDVGTHISYKMRKHNVGVAIHESSGSGSGVAKRPHARRGHWHHFWTGSHSDNSRKLVLKWLAPTYINGDKDDTVITVNKI